MAAAPGEARGDTLVPKRGDFASGEAVRPASAMAPTVAELGDESMRLRFNGRAEDWSGVGGVLAARSGGGGGAESGMLLFLMSAVGAVVGADPGSEDSMRANAAGGCGWMGVGRARGASELDRWTGSTLHRLAPPWRARRLPIARRGRRGVWWVVVVVVQVGATVRMFVSSSGPMESLARGFVWGIVCVGFLFCLRS